jgi:hypothetical protein
MLWVGSGPRHDIAGAPNRQPLTAHTCLEVGMTGQVILGRASRALSSASLQPSRPQAIVSSLTHPLPTPQLANRTASVRPLYSILHTRYSRIAPCPRVTLPACPLARARPRVTVPTCPLREPCSRLHFPNGNCFCSSAGTKKPWTSFVACLSAATCAGVTAEPWLPKALRT